MDHTFRDGNGIMTRNNGPDGKLSDAYANHCYEDEITCGDIESR